MNVVRASTYSVIATGARLLAALVVIKLVAWFAGPEGVGKMGQFMSLMSLLAVLAGGGIGTGVVKYVAEYRHDTAKLARLLSAALWYAVCASCAMCVVTLIFNRPITQWLMGDLRYQGVIQVLAVAQLGIALANYGLAVINGFMDVRRLALVQVVGSMGSIVAVVLLARAFQLYGALLALIVGQLALLVVGFPALKRSGYFLPVMFRARYDREMVSRLAAFSVMTLVSALLPPLVGIGVRDHLAGQFGWQQVGYWQAVSKVSDAYLLFATSAINIYYLPKLASTHDRASLVAELQKAYRIVLPVVAALAAVVYAQRSLVTRVLFSANFYEAKALYAPQLIGDVLKIASFILSYLMLAKAMTRLFVASECVFAISYVALVYVFTAYFGLIGAMYAFAVNYLLYLTFNVVVARRYLRGVER
ncbi:O-antigen translocase [Dyella sp. 2HG41-7]|uniref:O-antigen translocase n=1 Tax=Dyella sp. 2HG41-7 TaxID=2883239 RepID=UPI001F42B9E2|nr:O-antigen translocase [Dyella sp. 2HG41-7]